MALPSSPPLSLTQVCAEFGAPSNTPLTSFLRGGPYVPNISQNNSVPTSLPISLLDLLGATNASLSLNPDPLVETVFQAEPAPNNRPMAGSVVASGAGVSSVSWVRLSGDSSISVSQTGLSTTFSATVFKNLPKSAVFRCTASNGLTDDLSVTLDYYTDL